MIKKPVPESLYENDEDFDDEDYYDMRGNATPGGLFDAGGHPIAARWAEYADWISDTRDNQ